MEILTMMVIRRNGKQVKCEGYKIKVNENSLLIFETKIHYRFIKELEKILFCLVSDVLKENEYEYDCEVYGSLGERFKYIEKDVKESPLMKVNSVESEKNENLDHPFEIMFPTLVYFFMRKHDKEDYWNYKLFCRKIQTKDLVLPFKFLRREILKVIKLN